MTTDELGELAERTGVLVILVATLAILMIALAWSRRSPKTVPPHRSGEELRAQHIQRARARANALTYVIASIGTAASLVGMWPVTRTAVVAAGVPSHWVTAVSVLVLGLLEGTIVVCGIRARANVLETGETGVDGLGLWVAVGASSLLSATEAAVAAPPGTQPGQQVVTVMVRLTAPIVAGWLWERGLAPERRAARGVRTGLLTTYLGRLRTHLMSWADRADADQISRRRATRRATHLVDRLRGADTQKLTLRQRWHLRRLRRAVRITNAAHDPADWEYLSDELAASQHALGLADLRLPSPWVLDMAHGSWPPGADVRVEQITAAAAPAPTPTTDPDSGITIYRFPTGREAYTSVELDQARQFFADHIAACGQPPKINALAKALGRRWERAKRIHDVVANELQQGSGTT